MRHAPLGLVLLAAGALAGCGSSGGSTPSLDGGSLPTVTARGKVSTADGKPLPGGIITLVPVIDGGSANQASGEIKPDGTFELDSGGGNAGAVPGKYRARIESTAPTAKARAKAGAEPLVEVKDGADLDIKLP
jgi:hypothetical protein